jgi:glycosyltransferase involved in cell wall biosynthesis
MISVCIATYNGEKYIKDQLVSILHQLRDEDEVIISDDFSVDNTLEIIKSFNDARIKIFMNAKEKGFTKNFENALEKVRGDIIFLSDQDDIWMPNKVNVCVSGLKNSDFIVHDGHMVNKNIDILNESIFEFRNVKNGFLKNFVKIRYLGCCMAFNKNILNKSLPFPANQILTTHDSWLTLVSELYFNVNLVHQPLIKYRRHGENASLGGAKGGNSLITKVLIRAYSLFHLIKIYFRR